MSGSDEPVTMTKGQLDEAINKAVEGTVTRMFKELGISDVDAANDIRELRSLLKAWREVRRQTIGAAVKFLTTAILAAILLAVGIKIGAANLLK